MSRTLVQSGMYERHPQIRPQFPGELTSLLEQRKNDNALLRERRAWNPKSHVALRNGDIAADYDTTQATDQHATSPLERGCLMPKSQD